MPARRTDDLVQISLTDGSVHEVELETLRFHHAIAETYSIELVVVAGEDLDLEHAVGTAIRIAMHGLPAWSLGSMGGLLWGVRLLSCHEPGRSRHALSLVPPARSLCERDDHRIFQDLSVPEIVSAVLAGAPGSGELASRLIEEHPPREFVVQYGESDLALIERLAADDGITLVHDARRDGAVTLVDDTTRLDRSSAIVLKVSPESAGRAADGIARIFDVEVRQEVRTNRVTVGDYDCRKPRHVLAADAASSETTGAEIEHYAFGVGRFASESDGKARAKRLLEGRRVGARELSGRVSDPIAAGDIVRVEGHRRPGVDGDWLVVESNFEVTPQGEKVATIRAIPADACYRSPRRDRPKIAGTQTATVVGAPGEKVDVDADGRIEIAFHWDRRRLNGPGASRRVRVAQSWGGSGHGMFTVPRVGDEVIVAFSDGDPDEPLVVGQVHNAVRPTPLALPESKTQAVWRSQSIDADGAGFNQILMDDDGGKERLELKAQRDFAVETARNERVKVGSSASRSVGGSESHSVGGSQEVTVGQDKHVVVKELWDLHANNVSVGAAREICMMCDDMALIANSRTDQADRHVIETQNLVARSSDTTAIVAKRVQLMVGEVFEVILGAFSIRADAAGIVLSGPGSTLKLSPEGISLATAGVVDIHGALVKINC